MNYTRQKQVAKKLPHLPRGVDPTNLRVIACVRRIAAEAGELCASDTIADAKQQVCILVSELGRDRGLFHFCVCNALFAKTKRNLRLPLDHVVVVPRGQERQRETQNTWRERGRKGSVLVYFSDEICFVMFYCPIYYFVFRLISRLQRPSHHTTRPCPGYSPHRPWSACVCKNTSKRRKRRTTWRAS